MELSQLPVPHLSICGLSCGSGAGYREAQCGRPGLGHLAPGCMEASNLHWSVALDFVYFSRSCCKGEKWGVMAWVFQKQMLRWNLEYKMFKDRSNYISFSSTWNQTLMVSIPNLFYILLNKVKPHSKTSKWYNTVVFSHRNKKFTWNSLTLLQDFVLWGKKLGRNYCIIGFWLGLKSMKISLFNIKTFHRK